MSVYSFKKGGLVPSWVQHIAQINNFICKFESGGKIFVLPGGDLVVTLNKSRGNRRFISIKGVDLDHGIAHDLTLNGGGDNDNECLVYFQEVKKIKKTSVNIARGYHPAIKNTVKTIPLPNIDPRTGGE